MKKRKLILIGLLIWHFNSVFGQSCGTPHPVNPTVYPQEDTNLQARGSSSALCIDIFFHIVRNSNGTNNFALPDTDAVVREMNEVYSTHNIIINNAGINFIDNTDLLIIDTNSGEDNTLFGTQNREEFINFYIVDRFTREGLVGKAQKIPSRNLVMRHNDILTNVSAHELGHCLNLYHTHQSGGDMVNDTPNDPGLGSHNVNTNCQYTGGGGFNPLTNNIMSYSRINCLTDFTNGQSYRMRYAIQNEPILQDISSNSCTKISLVNNICYSQTTTVNLTNTFGATTSWTSSSNVQIVSSNNSSAKIRAKYSHSTGNGWVKATLSNGVILQENFQVGSRLSLNTFGGDIGPYGQLDVSVSGGTAPYKYYRGTTLLKTSYNSSVTLAFGCNGGVLKVEAQSSCGTTSKSTTIMQQCNNYYSFSIYPNPTSRTLNIEAIQEDSLNNIDYLKYDVDATYEFYDFSSNLKQKGNLKDLASINVKNYKKGRYILKINHNNQVETHQIIIK